VRLAEKKLFAKNLLRTALKKLLWSRSPYGPPSGLAPDNLYAYLDALYKKRNLNGAIVEVGCAGGGTTAIAYSFLARQNIFKNYICIDTFKGFIADHLDIDRQLGLPSEYESAFSNNSKQRVEETLKSWGISQVDLIEGDITSIDESLIPQEISVCLMDVDLKVPTYKGLRRIYPKLQEGGVILVDDCTIGTSWVGALQGYREFVNEQGLPEKYFMSFGVVEKKTGVGPLNWLMSSYPSKETWHGGQPW
jgi:O-methyltransferase